MKKKTTKKPVKKTTKKPTTKKPTTKKAAPKQKPISVIKFNAAEIQLLQGTLYDYRAKISSTSSKTNNLTHVLIATNGDIVATNGKSLVLINKEYTLKKDILVSVNIKIEEDDLIELDLKNMKWVLKRGKEIFRHSVTSINTFGNGFKYPDYKSAIPKDEGIVYKTCVDVDLIPKGVKLTMNFYEYGTAPIKCKLNSNLSYDGDIKDVTFLLMPIKLKDGQAGFIKK